MIVPATAALFCCLALVFPSRAMAGITTGTAQCDSSNTKQLDNAVGCVIPLHVKEPGHKGSGNPDDWGMCGVLSLKANFGPETVARIIVDSSGLYQVELQAYKKDVLPTLKWTCVLFSDFKGTPSDAEATSFGPVDVKGGAKDIAGSAGNACPWAGVSGNLEGLSNEGAFGSAFAEFETPVTSISASAGVSSYAFCSAYSAASWKGWKYLLPHAGVYNLPHPVKLGLSDTEDWCYLGGMQAHLSYPPYSVGVISAGLDLSGGDYSVDATPAGGTWMSYNCLPLTQ